MDSTRMVVLAWLIWFVPMAAAQGFRGTILGTVTDVTGAVVPQASVRITNTQTNETLVLLTNELGNYQAPLLPVGEYQVAVERQGFRTVVRRGIVLQVDQRARVDFVLQPGTVAESISVTADAPLLEAENSSLGQVITNKTIVEMPLTNRNALQLSFLVPGASFPSGPSGARGIPGQGNAAGNDINISGGRQRTSEILLDGTANTHMQFGGVDNTPSVDAIQEFKVQTNAFSAEFGRTGGGVVNVVLKSGTNRFHGSAFEFFRNTVLNARDFFATDKPQFNFNQFGGSLGGPIRKDSTWFFANYEGIRLRQASTFVGAVPTELQRAGDFSQTFDAQGRPASIYDPGTQRTVGSRVVRDPFPGNRIPAARFDPIAANALPHVPLPNRVGTVSGASNYGSSGSLQQNWDSLNVKIDRRITDYDKIFGRLSVDRFPQNQAPLFPGSPASDQSVEVGWGSRNATLNYTRTFRANLVNELRAGFSRWRSRTRASALGQGWPAKLGLKGVPYPGNPDVFPRFQITGYTAIGTFTSPNSIAITNTFQLADTLVYYRGRHTVKTGAELRRYRAPNFLTTVPAGQFGFSSLYTDLPGTARTGHPMASFLLGLANNVLVTDNPYMYEVQSWYFGGFLQDDVRLTSSLHVNLGVRYQFESPRTERYNLQSNLDLATGRLFFADSNRRTIYNGDYNNFDPRVGFSWQAARKVVVRGGYGIFTVPATQGAATAALLFNTGFTSSVSFPAPDNVTPALVLREGVPYVPPNRNPTGVTVTAVPLDFPAGYAQQWNFGVQRELAKDLLVEAAYAGSKGTHLVFSGRDLNTLSPELLGPPERFGGRSAQQRRPYPQYQTISFFEPSASSSYHSLQVRAEKRLSKGLSFLVAYTAAKSIDNNSGFGVALAAQNQYDLRAERSLSVFDVAQRLVVSHTYALPFGQGRRFLNRGGVWNWLLGGWDFVGITQFQSGAPIIISNTPNVTNSFSGSRPNVVGDPFLPKSERTLDRWFNTAAFAAPPEFAYGNGPRTLPTMRKPGLVNFDFSLLKNAPIREGLRLQLRAEFFNCFNNTNFDGPGGARGGAAFGVISATGDPRIVQLGAKLIW